MTGVISNNIEYVYMTATALGFSGAVAWAVRKIAHAVNRRSSVLDGVAEQIGEMRTALLGDAPTLENPSPAPGLIERIDNLEKAVADLKKEVTPNGGQTNRLGDRVRRTEEAINQLTTKQ